jgi:glycosyltransferase involved in cell wall biosynthesis
MLAELVADPALRARIGAANRARAIAHYDAAKMVAQSRAAYGEALGRAF